MICYAQAVSEKWPALVEAGATVVLAAVAIFQWHAMRGSNTTLVEQSKLERDRWKREDEIRKEANRPKAEFWFAIDTQKYRLTGINLGQVAFVLREIWVQAVVFREVDAGNIGGPICLQKNVNLPMPIGERVEMTLSMDKEKTDYWLNRSDGGCNWEFIFRASTPYGAYEEIRRPFNTCGDFGMERGIWRGFLGNVLAQCPTCGLSCNWIIVNDLNSSDEIKERLDGIHQDYKRTCPTHTTTSDKVYMMPEPTPDAPGYAV